MPSEKFWLDPAYATATGQPFPLRFRTLYSEDTFSHVLGGTLGLTFLLLFLYAYFAFIHVTSERAAYSQSIGTVLSCRYTPHGTRSNASIGFAIAYADESGTSIQTEVSITGSVIDWRNCDQYPVGSKLQISYLPGQPNDAFVTEPSLHDPVLTPTNASNAILAGAGLCGLVSLAGWLGIVRRILARKRYILLRDQGQLREGELISLNRNGRSDGRIKITAIYRFEAPDGTQLTGRQRTMMDTVPKVQPGTPITVLYHSRRVHCML